MTQAEKLTMLKVLVGIPAADTSEDVALAVYLSLSASKILHKAYPFDSTVTDVPDEYAVLQCEVAAYLWNKRGAEGETAHNENGINRSYEDGDVPPSMLRAITPHAAVPTAPVVADTEVGDENDGA